MKRQRQKRPRSEHVAVRIDPETLARLDALLPHYELPGREATRSDALRAVILAGLKLEEAKPAPTRPA